MKKTERHLLIQQMIRNEKLSTQKEIQDRLEAKGIAVTLYHEICEIWV